MPAATGGKLVAQECGDAAREDAARPRKDRDAICLPSIPFAACFWGIIAVSGAVDKYKKCNSQIKVADIRNG
ncbi:MAG: hypothetical protein R3E35_02620 [Rhodocyclaceae bacterium]|jgi:hypothetical protein